MNGLEHKAADVAVAAAKGVGVLAFIKGGFAAVKGLQSRASMLSAVTVSRQVALDSLADNLIGRMSDEMKRVDGLIAGLNTRLDDETEKRKFAEIQAEVSKIGREDAERALGILRSEYELAITTVAELRYACQQSSLNELVFKADIIKKESDLHTLGEQIAKLTLFIERHFGDKAPSILEQAGAALSAPLLSKEDSTQ